MDKKRFLVNTIVGLVMAVFVFFLYWEEERSILHRLCDACFVPSIMLMGVGFLKLARNAGTFDMMGYGIGEAVHMMMPWLRSEKKDVDFVAYKERKKGVRKSSVDLLAAGGIYLVLSIVFLILYTFVG